MLNSGGAGLGMDGDFYDGPDPGGSIKIEIKDEAVVTLKTWADYIKNRKPSPIPTKTQHDREVLLIDIYTKLARAELLRRESKEFETMDLYRAAVTKLAESIEKTWPSAWNPLFDKGTNATLLCKLFIIEGPSVKGQTGKAAKELVLDNLEMHANAFKKELTADNGAVRDYMAEIVKEIQKRSREKNSGARKGRRSASFFDGHAPDGDSAVSTPSSKNNNRL